MTYFGFLLRFLATPLAILLWLALTSVRRGSAAPGFAGGRMVGRAIGLHVVLAIIYTTPWDNYLVATGVWSYHPKLISGVLLGWVPLEEYLFFVLETLLTGLWWWFLAQRITPSSDFRPAVKIRRLSTFALGVVWLCSVILLASGWRQGTYLSLILAWVLPALMLQFAFGADILWHYRRLVFLTIMPAFLYVSAADSLAIAAGTWAIAPDQSTGIIIGTLPVEEAIFFLTTVTLIACGLTLSLACASQARWESDASRMIRLRPDRD